MILRFDEYELDDEGPELWRHGAPVKADALVLRVLSELARHSGHLVTKEQLIARVWDARAVSENVITVAIARLRRTLGQAKGGREFVLSVHGRGYRFVRPVTQTSSPESAPSPALLLRGLPFVGRERVLHRLRLALADLRRGTGSLCILIGEPGIGKTSAAEVVDAEATAAGFFVAWGFCRESGDTPPLGPFARLVRDALERAPIDPRAPRLSTALDDLRRALPELDPVRGAATESVKEAHFPEGERPAHRLFEAVVRVLSRMGEQVPCVFVLDDLHRADTASLEVLRFFADEIAHTRVLVVGTLRDGVTLEAPASGHLAYVLGHRNAARLTLDRLAESEVGVYLGAVLRDWDAALAHSIHRKSEGNPFFMAEFARLLCDGSGARLPALSDAAFDLVRQRVSTMDDADRKIVSVAAVLGNPFDLPLLHDVCGVPHDQLMASLDHAVAAGVLTRVPDCSTAFRFTHDLLRAVLYDDLNKGSLRALHARTADALRHRKEFAGSVPPGDLAYHAYAALPDGDPRQAVHHCLSAATAAADRRAYGDAIRYTRHAREALELVPQPSPRLRLELVLQHALFARTCASPEFAPTVREAILLARSVGSPSALARAALMLDLHPGFPSFAGARAALEEARDALAPDDDVLPAVLARLVISAPTAYDADRASSDLARCIEMADKKKALLPVYTVRAAQLHLCGGPSHEDKAAVILREVEALCASAPQTLAVAPVLVAVHRAIVLAQRGKGSLAGASIERAIRLCRELGHQELGWHAERFRLLSRVNAGHREAVALELRQHHRRAERESLMGTAVFLAFDEFVVLGSCASEAEAFLPALAPDRDDSPNLWSLKLRALAAAGRRDEARESLRRLAPADLERLPCDRDYLGTLGALTCAALWLGESDYLGTLEKLLRPYPRYFAVNVSYYCHGAVSDLLEAIVARRSASHR